jgi:aminocarboxymuconate-semialdehyde decarboxylase
MNAMAVDMEVLPINPFWYRKERDLAAEIVAQLETAMKKQGLRGAAIGGSVAGADFSDRNSIPSGPRPRIGAVFVP